MKYMIPTRTRKDNEKKKLIIIEKCHFMYHPYFFKPGYVSLIRIALRLL